MSDDERRVEEINETDLEEAGSTPRQRSARNDTGMRDGDDSHGNPYPETWQDHPQEDSDTDVGDTAPSLESEELGVLDAVPANEIRETRAEERETDEEAIAAAGTWPTDRPAAPESRTRNESYSNNNRDSARDREPPLENYSSLTIPQIFEKIPTLSNEEVRAIRDYEKSHRRRKTLLVKLERHLRPTEGPPQSADRSRRA